MPGIVPEISTRLHFGNVLKPTHCIAGVNGTVAEPIGLFAASKNRKLAKPENKPKNPLLKYPPNRRIGTPTLIWTSALRPTKRCGIDTTLGSVMTAITPGPSGAAVPKPENTGMLVYAPAVLASKVCRSGTGVAKNGLGKITAWAETAETARARTAICFMIGDMTRATPPYVPPWAVSPDSSDPLRTQSPASLKNFLHIAKKSASGHQNQNLSPRPPSRYDGSTENSRFSLGDSGKVSG